MTTKFELTSLGGNTYKMISSREVYENMFGTDEGYERAISNIGGGRLGIQHPSGEYLFLVLNDRDNHSAVDGLSTFHYTEEGSDATLDFSDDAEIILDGLLYDNSKHCTISGKEFKKYDINDYNEYTIDGVTFAVYPYLTGYAEIKGNSIVRFEAIPIE